MMPIIVAAHAEKIPYPELSLYVLGFILAVCLLMNGIQWLTDSIWPKEIPRNEVTSAKKVIQSQQTVSTLDQLDSHLIAAIAAAVYSTLGDNTKILSIKTAPSSSWAEEGRRQQFQKKF